MNFKIGDNVVFNKELSGNITKVYTSSLGHIMCADVAVKPITELEKLFSKDGFINERISYNDVNFINNSWVIKDYYNFKNSKD